MKKILKSVILVFVIFLVATAITWKKVEKEAFEGSFSNSNLPVDFELREGEGVAELGKNLESQSLIKSRFYFYYNLWRTGNHKKLQAGHYQLAPSMTIPEIVKKITGGEVKPKTVKLVVPEGFNNKKIISLLKDKKPNLADEFEKMASCKCLNQKGCDCDKFSQGYDFIRQIPSGVDLEGYLFPDTYFIEEDDTAETLMNKFLENFEKKKKGTQIENFSKMTLHEIITMASIVEREAATKNDRELVAGVLWNRLEIDMPLQVDATLSYILDEDRVKYHTKHIQKDSPYNTYLNKGLPPGPIANPGLESILATINYKESDYLFFLSDVKTNEMFFAKTGEEQEENKKVHGL